MATIKRWIGNLVAFGHDNYAKLPIQWQTFLGIAVVIVYTMASSYGFHWTGNISDLGTQLTTFAVLAYAAILPLFQRYVLPTLVESLISLFGFIPTASTKEVAVGKTVGGYLPRAVILWQAA
jgi:hypothetical protein